MAGRFQHLRHNIFYNHAAVKFEFVKHDFALDVTADDVSSVEGMADEQARVGHVPLYGLGVLVEI